ncbi:hypothetical protein RF55_19344 [Lasius niger]|uniref:DUF5641 domain-containing protein n=1 Tax=Lasius niger TaxID=67767 RepID=A0A0J7K048_LASNI|nr:hypothetical protein RF55_19344 [Lasius niger]
MSALTPGHFLTGDALTAIPENDYTTSPINRLNRWQLAQRLVQHFWNRWSKEHLHRLQQRPKWLKKTSNLQPGDLVLIKEENQPPLKWRLGRILEVFHGTDGCVRVVQVKTADGQIKRPICKLAKLPIDDSI